MDVEFATIYTQLFENIILDKNEKSMYGEREMRIGAFFVQQSYLQSQCEEYQIFFGFGLGFVRVYGRFELSLKMKYFMEMEN